MVNFNYYGHFVSLIQPSRRLCLALSFARRSCFLLFKTMECVAYIDEILIINRHNFYCSFRDFRSLVMSRLLPIGLTNDEFLTEWLGRPAVIDALFYAYHRNGGDGDGDMRRIEAHEHRADALHLCFCRCDVMKELTRLPREPSHKHKQLMFWSEITSFSN